MLLEVLADAEGPAGAGQHHAADGVVVGDRADGVEQRLLRRDVEAVHRLGSVQGDGRDAVGDVEQHGMTSCGHARLVRQRPSPRQARINEPLRSGSSRCASSMKGPRPPARARRWKQLAGERRVAEQELAPLVDQPEARREDRLASPPVASRLGADQAVGQARPGGVGRGERGQVPRPVGRAPLERDRVRGRPPARATTGRPGRPNGHTQTPGACSATRGMELLAQPRRGTPVAGRVDEGQPPAPVPGRGPAVDPGRGAGGARRAARRPGSRADLTADRLSQPGRTIRETAVRTAGRRDPTGASNRTRADTGAGSPRERGGGRRTRRTGPTGHACGSLCQFGRPGTAPLPPR